MKRFVLTKPAERQLDAVKRYLIEKAGSTSAALLGRQPDTGHVREDLTSRPVKFWPVYSYLIVYDPKTEPIQIVRVLHGNRDIEQVLN